MIDPTPATATFVKPQIIGHRNPRPRPDIGQRARLNQRRGKLYRIRIGENDQAIINWVYQYRIISQEQIQLLLGRSRSTVQRLLRRLYDHGYLERVFLPVRLLGSNTPQCFYVLDKRGVELLQQAGITTHPARLAKSFSAMYMEHTNAINNFRIQVQLAAQAANWQIVTWMGEGQIKSDYDRVSLPDRPGQIAVIPDGYFCLNVPGKGKTHFFLELDRGTMKLGRFQQKVEAYVAYYKSGGYKRRYQAGGFRVLTVVSGVGRNRVKNLADISTNVTGIGRRFWFAHLDQLIQGDVFGDKVWRIAGSGEDTALFD